MTTASRNIDSDIAQELVRIQTRLDSTATKEDVALSNGELRTDMATRFGEQDAQMEARLGELDAKMEARFGELETKMEARFGELRLEIANFKTEVIRWIVGAVAISATIVVSIVTVMDQLTG